MVFHVDGSLSLTVEITNIIEEEDGGDSKRIPSFVLGFADILLRVKKHRD